MIGYLLAIINMVCFLLHILLEAFLWNRDIPFVEFLLIENALISLLYLFFAWSLVKGKSENCISGFHTLFWLIFTIFVIVLKPSETTLEIFRRWIEVPQWIALFVTGTFMTCLSIIDFGHRRKGNEG